MTPKNTNPTGSSSAVGSGNIVLLGGNRQTQGSAPSPQTQAGRLFGTQSRADILLTAHEYNAAAARNRRCAIEDPSLGDVVHRVADHYARMARLWFARADAFKADEVRA